MSKNDPDRINFQNELVTAKRKLEEMKDKYKFENFKYLNSFESYNESIEESKNIILNGVDFGIKYSDLSELMYEITDEFQGLNWFMINSNMSAIILDSPNSFVIELFGKGEFPSQLPNLYYLEPKIHNLIGHINDQLGRFGLEVYFSDFGQNDAYYEIVITKKGNKPRMNPDKFEVSSDGEISYKD